VALRTGLAIASGSKGFTALVALSLAADGTTRARELLGADLPLVDDRVTVVHLLGHRSGIGDYLDESAGHQIDDYVMTVPVHQLADSNDYLKVLDEHPQHFTPGERFAYNNAGFVLLAILAERPLRPRLAACHRAGSHARGIRRPIRGGGRRQL
jgi:CubicO group peptidase (beta-lactamase class C family)